MALGDMCPRKKEGWFFLKREGGGKSLGRAGCGGKGIHALCVLQKTTKIYKSIQNTLKDINEGVCGESQLPGAEKGANEWRGFMS